MNLKFLLELTKSDLVFLSEPKVFQHDLPSVMKYFSDFKFSLNSEDLYDPEAPLVKNQTFGGTMVGWRNNLDPFIAVYPVSSTSYLPIILSLPGAPVSIHIAIYLPTSGQDLEFSEQITSLRVTLEDLKEKYPNCTIYLRGDSNANINNKARYRMFQDFITSLNLKSISTNHKTYHHFIGNGLFDSSIDVILHSNDVDEEIIEEVFCCKVWPEVDSHHDALISSILVPLSDKSEEVEGLIVAPRVTNNRQKVVWSEDSILNYQHLVVPQLQKLRKDWFIPNSPVSFSILLSLTNDIFNQGASKTCKVTSMISSHKSKSLNIPPDIKKAWQVLKSAHNKFKTASCASRRSASKTLSEARKFYRFLIRKQNHQEALLRDSQLFSVCSNNPSKLYKKIRSSKSSSVPSVPFLQVGEKKYPGTRVCDGMFDSINTLKHQNTINSSPCYDSWTEDYRYILQLCNNKRELPEISEENSGKILKRMKSGVQDLWSITPQHFINAGKEGLAHFHFLMNRVITEINLSSVNELNTVYALLLYKRHNKPRTSDKSYRTISTCPVLAKGLDIYISDLYKHVWNTAQADTQYQGEGRTHGLAALLLTEAIQHSLHQLHKPIFLLFLDARSAFDRVVISFLIRNFYLIGMEDKSLIYLNNRLSNRVTYVEWNKELMGPIIDELGLEQGGCTSSEAYKVYNNDLLKILQDSSQGVDMGDGLVVSGVGQADDVALLSNNIFCLYNLLYLTLNFCKKFNIDLCPEKTKLLMLKRHYDQNFVAYNPIRLNGKEISFSQRAEHVGIIRSEQGNTPNLMNRLSAHKRSLAANLFTGTARSHRGNLAASIKLEKLYSLPVLLSGLPSLVLSKTEVTLLDQHYLTTLRNLIKCHQGTPQSFVFFVSGSLPVKAILHLRQLGLFGMITRLPVHNPLSVRAKSALLTSTQSCKSWFNNVREICLLYGLPHPLSLLQYPPPREAFKKLVKSLVTDYWEQKLRMEASILSSLTYFQPAYHSLSRPHPILWTPGANPYEVGKAVIQLRMLSGRYRTAMLTRHWSPSRRGTCPVPSCKEFETLEHLLIFCPYYEQTRERLKKLWLSTPNPYILQIATQALTGPVSELVQLLLDASVTPTVISLTQVMGYDILKCIFHLTRTWCYAIHRERVKMQGRFHFD